jgi:hypothetical protein
MVMVRFLGNKNKMEVHDLINEETNCQIKEIKSEHKKYFTPDTLEQARKEGFDNCAWCLGGSKR